jgi:hypothetical protein
VTVKQGPVERVADTTVTWTRLTPELLIFKVSNENRLETDLAFARQ